MTEPSPKPDPASWSFNRRGEIERLVDPFLAGLRQELESALRADTHAPEASWQAIKALFERLDNRDVVIARIQRLNRKLTDDFNLLSALQSRTETERDTAIGERDELKAWRIEASDTIVAITRDRDWLGTKVREMHAALGKEKAAAERLLPAPCQCIWIECCGLDHGNTLPAGIICRKTDAALSSADRDEQEEEELQPVSDGALAAQRAKVDAMMDAIFGPLPSDDDGADDAELEDRVLAALVVSLVEVETMGRRYSEEEDIPVLTDRLRIIFTNALIAARKHSISQRRDLLPCGHVAANIGDTGACEACNDMAAKYEQGRAEMREMIAKWHESQAAFMQDEGRYGFSRLHMACAASVRVVPAIALVGEG